MGNTPVFDNPTKKVKCRKENKEKKNSKRMKQIRETKG
jgi:hypothetical protein